MILDLLKKAIKENNMEHVHEVFRLITGKSYITNQQQTLPQPIEVKPKTKTQGNIELFSLRDDDEPNVKINDNVQLTPRNRPPGVCQVFCQDCKKTVEISTKFKKDPYHCDLAKIGKCPNQRGG